MLSIIPLKLEQRHFSIKGVDGMANSVDPDQSDLCLHCFAKACLSESLGPLWYNPLLW